MNLYEKIRNAECEIPESFCMTIGQVVELIDNSEDKYGPVWAAFKFGYMQRYRVEQSSKTNKASGKGTASEADKLREHITEMTGRIRSEKRLRRIYTVAHRAFINYGLEGISERQN